MSAFSLNAPSLTLPGPRELLSTTAQVQDLITALNLTEDDLAGLRTVTVGDKSYTGEGARAMCEHLMKKCSAVTHLNLADIIAGRLEEEGLEVLSTFSCACAESMPNVTHIDLSDNAMGLLGVSRCAPLLKARRTTLTSLSFCNDGISHQGMEEVADILTAEPAMQFERLHFYNNMSGDKGCEHFKRILDSQNVAGKMTDIRFSGTRAGSAGSVHIAAALCQHTPLFGHSLRYLDLNDNTFTDSGSTLAKAFAAGFGKNLVELNLGECSMGDDTTKAIVTSLIKVGAGTLTKLELGGNELTIQSMKKVGALCGKNPNLKILGLSDNELSSGGAIALIDAGLKACPALTELKINSSELGDRGGKALSLAAGAWSALAKIDLDGNMFTEPIAAELQETFGEKLPEMEDNDEDGKDDDDEDEEIEDDDDEEEDGEVEELANAMGGAKV